MSVRLQHQRDTAKKELDVAQEKLARANLLLDKTKGEATLLLAKTKDKKSSLSTQLKSQKDSAKKDLDAAEMSSAG